MRRECAFCITNACGGANAEQIQILVELGVIETIVNVLKDSDPMLIINCLQALLKILESGKVGTNNSQANLYLSKIAQAEGFEIVKSLRNYPNNDIYLTVETLIKEFGLND